VLGITVKMADPDPSVSNGTCFYAPQRMVFIGGLYLPCGNEAFGNIHCCQAGDHCLEEGACYNEKYGTTYLAGCTDFDYKDASCPDKKSYYGMTITKMSSHGVALLTRGHN
jgi:hypothetical protein